MILSRDFRVSTYFRTVIGVELDGIDANLTPTCEVMLRLNDAWTEQIVRINARDWQLLLSLNSNISKYFSSANKESSIFRGFIGEKTAYRFVKKGGTRVLQIFNFMCGFDSGIDIDVKEWLKLMDIRECISSQFDHLESLIPFLEKSKRHIIDTTVHNWKERNSNNQYELSDKNILFLISQVKMNFDKENDDVDLKKKMRAVIFKEVKVFGAEILLREVMREINKFV